MTSGYASGGSEQSSALLAVGVGAVGAWVQRRC